ncbi:hypothetical protein [Microbacterium laevaniformans]|uniref:hypothetical protein n=1 Tax=Microbacterium laevaniformans TaxID=36807 RepID=UPI003D9933DF
MNDPLIAEYLPVVHGHIAKNYAWMARRGNCLITVEDLQQIAAIALLKLCAKWDAILASEGKSRDGNSGLFWTILKVRVRDDVLKYYARIGLREVDDLSDSIDDDDDFRTSIRAPYTPAPGAILLADVADFFDTLPRKDKVYIALRHYDELPYPQMASILGALPATTRTLTSRIEGRWRDFARNQFTDHSVQVPRRVEVGWEPSDSLLNYVSSRHRNDLPTYLGRVSTAFHADPVYLSHILSEAPTIAPGTGNRWEPLSPFIQSQIDKMIGDGVNHMEISRTLGISYARVRGHASRRRAA